jgi:hypothetical protein
VHGYRIWHELPGDFVVPSSPAEGEIAVVKVVVARRRDACSPLLPGSYEIVMGPGLGGEPDLPSADVGDDGEEAAVARALAGVDLYAWDSFVEPIYAAHTPRGCLAEVYLVRAFARRSGQGELAWRGWPPWEHATGLGTFYRGLGLAWPLVLREHFGQPSESRTSEICVEMRRAAREYVELKRAVRRGERVDESMSEYFRRAMSDDEKWIDREIREHEENLAAAQADVAEKDRGEDSAAGSDDEAIVDDARDSEGSLEEAFQEEGGDESR